MTTGQIVFFSGVALLALTIILAIIFIIRKPKYIPGNAIYGEAATRLTIHREPVRSINPDTAVLSGGKAKPAVGQTEKLMGTTVLPGQETEKLQEGTASLPGSTAKLQQTEKLVGSESLPERKVESQLEGTTPLADNTMKLRQAEGTAQLYGQSSTSKGGTKKLDSSKE